MDDLTTFLNSIESSTRILLDQQNKTQLQQGEGARKQVALVKGSRKKTAFETNGLLLRDELCVPYPSDDEIDLGISEQFLTPCNSQSELPKLSPARSHLASISPGSLSSRLQLPTITCKGQTKLSSTKTPDKRLSTLKLLDSPLYKSLSKPRPDERGFKTSPSQKLQKTLQEVDNVALLLQKLGLRDSTGVVSIECAADKRMCIACWANVDRSTSCEHHARVATRDKRARKAENDSLQVITRMQLQGPRSWSSNDLFVKYRAVKDREEMLNWNQQEVEKTWTALDTTDLTRLTTVPRVPRHPICALLEKLLNVENQHIQAETRHRNQTRTFPVDLNQLWLLNLDHFNLRRAIEQLPEDDDDESALKVRGGSSTASTSDLEATPMRSFNARQRQASVKDDDACLSLQLLVCGEWNAHYDRERVRNVTLVGNNPKPDDECFEENVALPDYTKVTALFTRKQTPSSSNTFLVRLVIALDSPRLSPLCFAWHDGSEMPPPELEAEQTDTDSFHVLQLLSPCLQSCLSTPRLESILDNLMPGTITLLNDASEEEEDHWTELTGHCRGWSEFTDRHGFRQWLLLSHGRTMAPCYEFATQHCSVAIARPNAPSVSDRFSWYEMNPVKTRLDHIRVEKEMLSLLQNHETSGPNELNYFSVLMNHEVMVDVTRASALNSSVIAPEEKVEANRLPFEAHKTVNIHSETWKRLQTSPLSSSFRQRVLTTQTKGAESSFQNKPNHASFLGVCVPTDLSPYEPPKYTPELPTYFVSHPLEDLQERETQWTRYLRSQQTLNTVLPAVSDRDMSEGFGERDASQYDEPLDQLEARAVLCARSNNITGLELALDHGVDVNTRDNHGNSLFILACQQGHKRLAKFLLRRHANVNLQNVKGNTALHYLYAYKHADFAEYIKAKGAKDTTRNAAGLTCYQGFKQRHGKDDNKQQPSN